MRHAQPRLRVMLAAQLLHQGGDAHGAARHPLYIVLDNIRSAHNVGNILRCAEAASIVLRSLVSATWLGSGLGFGFGG